MKHTPGEWRYIDGVVKTSIDGLPIHHTKRTEEEREANAKLIAAAPDLLEALKSCKALIEKLQDENIISNWTGEVQMNLAIEKATV